MPNAPTLLWEPSPQRISHATITRFTRFAEDRAGRSFPDYLSLWQWSVDELESFWSVVWEFFDVKASSPYERVLGSREMPGASWFPGARLNYAEHVLRVGDDDVVALRHVSETRPLAETTRGELRERVARVATGLRALGVGEGDRVAAYLPNVAETVIGLLATASLGAIWSSCAPEFGARSVIDRFAQIEPKVLLTIDGYRYAGRDVDRVPILEELRAGLPSVEHTVVLPYLDPGFDVARLPGALTWDELEDHGGELSFAQVPFDHPLWVLYSSGTTGLPKAIVHGHGGILLETLKQLGLHVDAQPDDCVFWFTTTGWMMWNFLVGALTTGASILLVDGSPGQPDLDRLWALAQDAGVTIFGTSPAFIGACSKHGVRPRAGRDLAGLRAVGVTGSPLPPEGFDWVMDELGPDVWLFSMSGGTDLCTAFVGGVPTLPVFRGELQARALGAAVEAWDTQGRPLVGAVGELVITEPMPSMPLGFWGDGDRSRYVDAYFSTYPGVWRHGDWIELTDRGSAIITGRSDATINRGGIRMGTSELYRAVLTVNEVVDALVVDVAREGTDGWMPLFVVLRPGLELTDELSVEIQARVRVDCSPRHVPDVVIQVADVPRTLSGKLLELPVKRILEGALADAVASRDALANPESLAVFETLAKTL